MRLTDKITVVTGGAQGIGRAICERLAQAGAKVIAVDLIDIDYASDKILGRQLDVTDREAIVAFVEETMRAHGGIDILVNNAGITKDALLYKMTEDMWDAVINVNLKGVFNLTQAIAPLMMEKGNGSIINMASIVGEYGNIGQSNYAATKAGVIALTKTWAKEFARKGAAVRVNAVSPGFVNTEMMKSVPAKVIEPIKSKTALKRLAEPAEIANVVLFLASEEASYITGHNLSVNGGLSL